MGMRRITAERAQATQPASYVLAVLKVRTIRDTSSVNRYQMVTLAAAIVGMTRRGENPSGALYTLPILRLRLGSKDKLQDYQTISWKASR